MSVDSNNVKQERFAGPAPRGEGQRMRSCLSIKSLPPIYNLTDDSTYVQNTTGYMGRAPGEGIMRNPAPKTFAYPCLS